MRLVGIFQPPAGGIPTTLNDGRIVTHSPSCYSEKNSDTAPPPPHVQLRQPISLGDLPMHHHQLSAPHHHLLTIPHHLRGDDGSSGYGSPDSETFEPTPLHQWRQLPATIRGAPHLNGGGRPPTTKGRHKRKTNDT